MIEKWKLTISQKQKYNFSDSTHTEEITFTHNRGTRLMDLTNYINDTFPEKVKFVLESVDEEDADDMD